MHKIFYPILVSLLLFNLTKAKVDIDKLIQNLSNEEKCGQMTQVTFEVIQYDKIPDPIDPDASPLQYDKLVKAVAEVKIGSILNTPYYVAQKASLWQKIIKEIQDVALNQTSNKIPILYGLDSIHGPTYVREGTLFPHPLATASSFNVDMAYHIGSWTALETRAVGVPWNFNPVLDVARQPLWSRTFETYGEDVYLSSKMGENYIKGSQGNDLKNRTKVATCLKHYIGYSIPFNGLDRTESYIPDILLREVFLPSFEAGVKAGSPTVMVNSGEVNGIPGHSNGYYINDILKGELKFDGFVVSDWEDIVRLYTRDRVAESPEEAVRMGVMAGVDMSMVPWDFSFYYHCVNLTKKDAKFTERVNQAAKKILKIKDDLGLFENAYPVADDLKNVGSDAAHEYNLEVAKETIILAKNENKILPINPSGSDKILVAGPSGNVLRVLNGGWSYTWQGNVEENFVEFGRKKYSIYESIKRIYSNVEYSEGSNFTHMTNFDETLEKAKIADIIVLTIGEDTYCETPGNIHDLRISDSQRALGKALLDLNKPTITIYIGGRARIMTEIAERSNAVLVSFLPGNRGGEAIAEVLFGKHNPSAKMPISYALAPNGIPTYDHKPLEIFDTNDVKFLFPFGHGLSYTQFNYSSLKLSQNEISDSETLKVSVQVRNVGDMDGKEAVILYLQDEVGSVSRPVKQVKRFEKVNLKKGESIQVDFELNWYDFSFIGRDSKRIVESGKFHIFIDNLNATFTMKVSQQPTNPTTKMSTQTWSTSANNFSTSTYESIKQFKLFYLFNFVLAILFAKMM